MGCNLINKDGGFTYSFRVWAPNAKAVYLIGDFCSWINPFLMKKITENGVYEFIYFSPTSLEKTAYKFIIETKDGRRIFKGDPYARFSRGLDDGASLVFCESDFEWCDGPWLKYRNNPSISTKYLASPLNIYEVHLSSFYRREKDNSPLNYREIADILGPYVKSMGYTHVELLPIAEHPYDGSWGYQVGGYYAPTSRFGDPDDFRYFVNKLHTLGIGVILDWVPAHFPKDEWGLFEFDGQPLYEYQGADRMESASWGTRFFDVGREEVQSFLISNALYFLREFHIDGLRVDAVASMLYLDYDRLPGEWLPNINGNNINLEAVAFFKKLNCKVFEEFPNVLMIAEESGSFGSTTKPAHLGGLGFNLKWNMGFANDFYDYLMTPAGDRSLKHSALTFPLMYAFSENYVLPVSHDEVVHGKLSFIDKMNASYEDKFLLGRSAALLIMTYPGKKLMFMGCEFAQFREWDYENSLEWFMLDYPRHGEFREFIRSLNHFYLKTNQLWVDDFTEDGFRWILPDEKDRCTVVYRRINDKGESIICAINFSDSEQQTEFEINKCKSLELLFATEPHISSKIATVYKKDGKYLAKLTLPKYSGVVLNEKTHKLIIKI